MKNESLSTLFIFGTMNVKKSVYRYRLKLIDDISSLWLVLDSLEKGASICRNTNFLRSCQMYETDALTGLVPSTTPHQLNS